MYCRELFEHCSLLRISSGVLSWPSPFTLRSTTESSSNSPTPNFTPSHLVHSKHLINSFVSLTSAPLHPQTLSFDRHPFFAGGGVGYQTGYPSVANSAFCPPVSPLATSLTDTLSRKSFGCHSYEKRWGYRGYRIYKQKVRQLKSISNAISVASSGLPLRSLHRMSEDSKQAFSRRVNFAFPICLRDLQECLRAPMF
jgi:hypothetical protein